jgi:hypothetical protein
MAGRGPGNTSLEIRALRCDFRADTACLIGYSSSLTIPSRGTWSKSIGAHWDLRGGDRAVVSWMNGKGDTVSRQVVVPYVEVRLGSAKVRGAGRSGVGNHVKLKSPTNQPKATLTRVPGPSGLFSGDLRHATSSVAVGAGDLVVSDVAPDAIFSASMTIVFLPGLPDAVGAHCQPGAAWRLLLRKPGGGAAFVAAGHADGSGTITVPGVLSSHSGWRMLLRCQTHEGDVIGRSMTLP